MGRPEADPGVHLAAGCSPAGTSGTVTCSIPDDRESAATGIIRSHDKGRPRIYRIRHHRSTEGTGHAVSELGQLVQTSDVRGNIGEAVPPGGTGPGWPAGIAGKEAARTPYARDGSHHLRAEETRQNRDAVVNDSGLRFDDTVPVEIIHLPLPPEAETNPEGRRKVVDEKETWRLAQHPGKEVIELPLRLW